MDIKHRLVVIEQKVRLRGDDAQHEQTDSWSNRDLIPLPPTRRTWGWFHFFGFWAISSLNIANWQTPNTFLTRGLSVAQSMMIIVVGRLLISMFSALIAWCGLKWHIGFTVQNRYTWGMRASYIPLLQRILLNFIWNAVQCWNGGRLVAVCVAAIWPSFARIRNTLPSSMPTTTYEFVGFTIFWFLSTPFLWLRPERFKLPFQIISVYCGIGMLSWMIWALATAKGVGPLWDTPENIPTSSPWNSSWLIMSGINQMLGGIAAGITNGSDFSRYARGKRHYIVGTILSAWITGTIVSFIGLVTASACQKIYGEVYWNPPDLLMVMMDSGKGSSKARAGVFFLSAGFALTAMFENICGNAVAGGIDLAGLFPRYIDIRRGAIITFVAAWIVQPWQLINRAITFISVLSSFSVFLAPIMGVMACDYYILRKRKIRLSHLYRTKDSTYYFWYGVNWRVIPAWMCGWAPTIGGLVVTVRGDANPPRALVQLYYMAFFIGFFTSATIFFVLNKLFPVPHMDQYDEVDIYGTFTEAEARKLGVIRLGNSRDVTIDGTADGHGSVENVVVDDIGIDKL
ncbi:NCS1 nucleoside transporter family protein-like protein [Lindgomyces ingoldianus]|uniref:NCS1 nucleoside transporter family protein-like protein n=1 Tax=Lindgomyces ingoldianus TaxID=673940 RepID=A0ACB6QAY0_9PLEO|nr:NCS1 nucleoside transporter family protein-like protein [Lindgomyces ingoldianus]KAF2464113.1 NCS1 nucleoside transporter family protein-like protein [Lindgomyces ingoldianus]